jgi:DNA-binding transcriptional MerR regulator
MSAATVEYLPTPNEAPAPYQHVTSIELMQRSGISYRQVDYWSRVGLLRPATDALPGNGYPRYFPTSEVVVATLMRQLTTAGLQIRVAHQAARELATTGTTTLAGIRLDLPQDY